MIDYPDIFLYHITISITKNTIKNTPLFQKGTYANE